MKILSTFLLLFTLQLSFIFAQSDLPEGRIEELKDKLELSESQSTKLETLLKDSRTKMEAFFKKNFEEREAFKKNLAGVRENTDKDIEKILDKKQLEKYKQIEAEEKGYMNRNPFDVPEQFINNDKSRCRDEQFAPDEEMPFPPDELFGPEIGMVHPEGHPGDEDSMFPPNEQFEQEDDDMFLLDFLFEDDDPQQEMNAPQDINAPQVPFK